MTRVHQSAECLEDLETRPQCPRGCHRGRHLPLRRDHPDVLHIRRLLDLLDLIDRSHHRRRPWVAPGLGKLQNQDLRICFHLLIIRVRSALRPQPARTHRYRPRCSCRRTSRTSRSISAICHNPSSHSKVGDAHAVQKRKRVPPAWQNSAAKRTNTPRRYSSPSPTSSRGPYSLYRCLYRPCLCRCYTNLPRLNHPSI